jgi:hypothetical protein
MLSSMHQGYALRHLTPIRAAAAALTRRNAMDEAELALLIKYKFDTAERE